MVGYCEQPSMPGQEMGYCREHAFPDQHDTIEMITGTCPATVFYREDGTAIILADDRTWIARVNTIGNADTAYLSSEPLETLGPVDLDELQGFRPGWEC
jgi:hypothetical protein